MLSNKTVFLIGLFSGLLAGLVWGLIIFTNLSQPLKLLVLILGAIPFFCLQNHIMKGIAQPDPNEVYSSRFWSLASQRFRKVGIFLSGAFAPYILALIGYLIINAINN